MNNKGFTLTETLLALVIIGVIASLTMPVIKHKSDKQEEVARLKKAFSTMSHVTNMIIDNEGRANASNGGWATSTKDIYTIYRQYIINAKDCGTKEKGCFSEKYTLMNNQTAPTPGAGEKKYSFVMSDGTEISMSDSDSDFSYNCSLSASGSKHVCQLIRVDVNGDKKPNKVGRDIFSFSLKSTGLYPSGCDSNLCSKKNSGWGCACKVLREGNINY